MDYPNYQGRGYHNIHQLEKLCEQFEEYIHWLNINKINKENVILKLAAYSSITGEDWAGRSNKEHSIEIKDLQEAVNWIKYWLINSDDKYWYIVDGDNKTIYLNNERFEKIAIKKAEKIFNVCIEKVILGFPEF